MAQFQTLFIAVLAKAKRGIVGWLTASSDALPPTHSMAEKDTQQVLTSLMVHDLLHGRKIARRWKILRRTAGSAGLLIALAYYVGVYASVSGVSINGKSGKFLGVVRVEGNIMQTSLASSEKIVPALKAAFEDPSVQVVVLAIDSGGGAPLEAERITYTIDTLKAKHHKPVYAVIQNLGASAAYMISMHCDQIYSGRYSLVGSIGAVMSSWDVHKALNKYDIYQDVYASGELKAMLNPFVAPTDAARVKAQQLVDKAGALFYAEMQESRKNKLKPGVKYDTGEIWDGAEALRIGLVDGLATIEELSDRHKIDIKEFGPGQRTLTPFSFSVSESLSQWLSTVVKGALIQATQDQTHATLK